LDLFFREFQYTEADLKDIPESWLLCACLSGKIDSDQQEVLSVLDLHLEEQHAHANPELISRAFRDLLRGIHRILLENEKQKRLSELSQSDPAYLYVLSEILQKEKQMGLRT
jgi:hypothetical protein